MILSIRRRPPNDHGLQALQFGRARCEVAVLTQHRPPLVGQS